MKESIIQRRLMDAVTKEFPDIYMRKIAQTMYSHGGVPDIVGCLNGLWFSVEVKTDTGVLSKLQVREGKLIEQAGGLFLVCYGGRDIEYIVSVLRSTTLSASA